MAETASVGPQVTRVRACELYDNGAGTTQTISEKSAFLNRLVTKEARSRNNHVVVGGTGV